jgi:ribonucleoside-diphosphate reductase alpha chain
MSYINGTSTIKFDFSAIRPKGSPISGGFLAPGPDKLQDSIEKIRKILNRIANTYLNLKTIDAFDIICHIANAVISGGVRRSALVTLFDNDDEDMIKAKTGNWFYDNPQRARSNNSAYFLRNNEEDKIRFKEFQKYIKEYGEPGFVFVDDLDIVFNPCVEIGMYPKHWLTGESGWQVCNLTTIAGNRIKTREEFLDACEASAIIGTVQATYTKFDYLGKVSEEIIRHEALLGCSITGIMNNWNLFKDPDILQDGANIIKRVNEKFSAILGINAAARCTCVKPEGNSSALVGSSSGCHGEHSQYYLRRVQVNKEEEIYEFFKKNLPQAVEDSVWGSTDAIITIPMTAPENSIFKDSLVNIKQLEIAKHLKKYWVDPGKTIGRCVIPSLSHNVSLTVEVTPDAWGEVFNYIWKNKEAFTGISLIPKLGDIIYPQAPFSTVLKPISLASEYGDGAIFSSGLIVDINHKFGSIWKALDAFRGKGEKLFVDKEDIEKFFNDYQLDVSFNLKYSNYLQAKEAYREKLNAVASLLEYDTETIEKLVDTGLPPFKKDVAKYLNDKLYESIPNLASKRDILRRVQKFADKFFEGNIDRMEECLKRVQNYKDWCDITKAYQTLNWNTVEWKHLIDADTLAAIACSGGNCEIV